LCFIPTRQVLHEETQFEGCCPFSKPNAKSFGQASLKVTGHKWENRFKLKKKFAPHRCPYPEELHPTPFFFIPLSSLSPTRRLQELEVGLQRAAQIVNPGTDVSDLESAAS